MHVFKYALGIKILKYYTDLVKQFGSPDCLLRLIANYNYYTTTSGLLEALTADPQISVQSPINEWRVCGMITREVL